MNIQSCSSNPAQATRIQVVGIACWILTILCYAALVVGSFVPQRELPRFVFSHDKLCHFVAYGGMMLLAAVAICQRIWTAEEASLRQRFALISAVGGFLLLTAFLGEVLQAAVGRSLDWWDFLASAGGVFAAIALVLLTLVARPFRLATARLRST